MCPFSQDMARSNEMRATLVIRPEELWRLRRESIGLTRTLPVDERSQADLRALRDSVVQEIWDSVEKVG